MESTETQVLKILYPLKQKWKRRLFFLRKIVKEQTRADRDQTVET